MFVWIYCRTAAVCAQIIINFFVWLAVDVLFVFVAKKNRVNRTAWGVSPSMFGHFSPAPVKTDHALRIQ